MSVSDTEAKLREYYTRLQARLQSEKPAEFYEGILDLKEDLYYADKILGDRIDVLTRDVNQLHHNREVEETVPPEQAAVPEHFHFSETPEDTEPREPTDPEARELYEFCRLVAGRANLPLREVWRGEPHTTPASEERPLVGPRRERMPGRIPPATGDDVPRPPSGPMTVPVIPGFETLESAAAASLPASRQFVVPDDTRRTVMQYLRDGVSAAVFHVLFLIRQMNNPRISPLARNFHTILRNPDHAVMFASWVAHLIMYWRTVNGESQVYRSQLPMAVLSYNLQRHHAYFSNL